VQGGATNERETIAEFERLAEAAYAAMFDVRPYNVKDCYDDVQLYCSRAIDAAERGGLADEVARLTRRREHVENVYNSQFRGVGR
jgi:hypothetical protein